MSFGGTGVLKPGNVLTIVAHIGLGKSQTMESIVSSYLNPYTDNLGIRVEGIQAPLLWIDGERTKDDIRIGFDRIKKRIRIEDNADLIAGDRFKNVHCHPFITYPHIPTRVMELQRLVCELSPGLVLLDGAADFVRDVNNVEETTDFVALLVALANTHSFAVACSIHPNPGQGQDSKPRGWLGSELLRKSESILLLKRAPDNRDVRILTMDFGHGKNRNAADNLEHAFSWNNEHRMFTSCNYAAPARPVKADEQQSVFSSLLSDNKQLTYGELVKAIIETGRSESTAKRWIRESQLIEKNPINDKYFLR